MDILKPKVEKAYEQDFKESLSNKEFEKGIFLNCNNQNKIYFEDLEFDTCIFHGLSFELFNFQTFSAIDVKFENCDLSNIDFSKSYFRRVVFNNCKLTGTKFFESSFHDVYFNNCKITYANFSDATLEKVIIEKSDLSYAIFMESKIKKIELKENNLNHTEFYQVNLKEVDLSSNDIYNSIFDETSLKGTIISMEQCVVLAKFLKVNIKE